MKLKVGTLIEIIVNSNRRAIIPTTVPTDVVKGVDVTNLSAHEKSELEILLQEYTSYLSDRMSSIFSFEEWVQQSYPSKSIDSLNWIEFQSNDIS